MNTAQLTFDNGQYKAMYQGVCLARSADVNYVIQAVEAGHSAKARQMQVTKIHRMDDLQVASAGIIGEAASNQATGVEAPYFPINERFGFLATLTRMVISGNAVSLLVTGPGGYGKTFSVTKEIKDAGLTFTTDFLAAKEDDDVIDDEGTEDNDGDTDEDNPADVHIVKGFSTAKGLYRTLYENNGRLIIFDDCDSIFRNTDAVNILKGALDSYDERWISWNAEPRPGERNPLPKKFEFTGRIIFISNFSQSQIDGAIKSRCLRVDLSMTAPEKIERMTTIIEGGFFMPDVPQETKYEAVTFLDEFKFQATELSMRTLISVTKIIIDNQATQDGSDWKRLALYNITAGAK